jgi:hypothetical protein
MGKYFPKKGITLEDLLADEEKYEYLVSRIAYQRAVKRWNRTWPLHLFLKLEDRYTLAARRMEARKYKNENITNQAELRNLIVRERRKEVGL